MSNKQCVCKGIRSCGRCDDRKPIETNTTNQLYVYCGKCRDKAFVQSLVDHNQHQQHCMKSLTIDVDYVRIDGLYVVNDIISAEQELGLVDVIDGIEWCDSQSGRRKQDFGPKVNFKKQKVRINQFTGLPHFDVELMSQMKQSVTDKTVLNDFVAVEVCHLEYCPENGSSIDMHFDDTWLWGPRLVTVNLLSPTVLTLSKPSYDNITTDQFVIRVDLPQRSLVVVSGDARYVYQHAIARQDITSRRIAITYRELSQEFLAGGQLYDSVGIT
ncbi:DNA N6-methyl adenine demethylase-like [Oppia nitens]|uniref:DNA N6-methyl adenine demethylase-like n=1 Tax=Oppia nitens TaxID=1686743 RepID=UPI0023DB5A99|nr:DNA N6-methyl adenine demethylase-like [Oppia nitens]